MPDAGASITKRPLYVRFSRLGIARQKAWFIWSRVGSRKRQSEARSRWERAERGVGTLQRRHQLDVPLNHLSSAVRDSSPCLILQSWKSTTLLSPTSDRYI